MKEIFQKVPKMGYIAQRYKFVQLRTWLEYAYSEYKEAYLSDNLTNKGPSNKMNPLKVALPELGSITIFFFFYIFFVNQKTSLYNFV